MQKKITVVFLFLCLLGYNECRSSHMLGADIEYTIRNKDSLDIYLTVYKDCKGQALGTPTITLRGLGCNYSYNYGMNQISCGDATPVCKKSCSRCDRSNCNASGYPNGSNVSCTFPYGIEKLVFKNTIILNNIQCCKFRVEFSQGTRSGAITTCCANEKLFTYCEFDRCNFPNNASPKAVGTASSIVCVGNCIGLNSGAIDTVDNDFVFYRLAPSLISYGNSCTYQGSYTYQSPLYYDGFPSIKKYNATTCKGIYIDSIGGGNIYCKPMQQQVAQFAVEILEYRKDSNCNINLMGITRRDFTLIVVANCTNKPPTFSDTTVHINPGAKICFDSIQSSDPDNKDTVTFSWNTAIPQATFETGFKSNSKKQYFNFCWQTDSNDARKEPYSFSATAEDNACPLVGKCTKSFTIYIDPKIDSGRVLHKVTKMKCGSIILEADYLQGNPCSYSYYWYINNYVYASFVGRTAIVNNLPSGKHYIRLEVSNGPTIYKYYDTVDLVGHLKLDIGKNVSMCYGNPVTFFAKVTQGTPPYKYDWLRKSLSDTLDSFVMNGTFADTVYCMVVDSEKCIIFDSAILYVNANPILNLGPDIRACRGQHIALTAPSGFKTYSWRDSSTNNLISNAASIKTDTPLTAICYISDANGCKIQDTISALFNPQVAVDIGSDRNICVGDSVHIIATGRGIHYWMYDTNSFIGDTLAFLPTIATKVVVKGSETLYNYTCTAVKGIMINLFAPPTIYMKDSFFVCKGDSRYIQVFGGTKYLWNTGDTARTIFVGVPGKYTVTVADTMGCHSSAQTELVNFPQTNVSLSFSNDTLYVNSNFSAKSFQWYLGNQYYTNTSLPWLYVTQAGSYKVNILDSNTCFTSSQPYLVTTLHSYILTPESLNSIKVYPNPSTGIYNIESTERIFDITIYDLMGRKVYYNSSNNYNIIDLSTQPEGIYLLQLNKNIWVRLSKL